MKWDADVIIYHDNCDDGFGCAWIADRKWPGIPRVPTNYGQSFSFENFRGQNVLIADFSFSDNELIKLVEIANSVIVLDHHKTAETELHEFIVTDLGSCENVHTIATEHYILAHFDMERSGAALTWDFCFPNDPAPVMVQFIEDRDLFRFIFRETKPFTYYLRSYRREIGIWNEINKLLTDDPNLVIGQGLAIERYHNRLVENIIPTATLRNWGKWKNVIVAHAPRDLASDVAHALLKKHPEASFSAVAIVAYGEREWTLRSDNNRQDVSEVASAFGGGGHRNSAGFKVPT